MSDVHADPCHASAYLVRAAVTAPSPYNTQPWTFVAEDDDRGVEVHADGARRLLLADPRGREMTISCGAALFNIRLAVRHLGFNPVVECFPRPADPAFLARVAWGAYRRPAPEDERLFGALRRRRTVRGPFLADPLPPSLPDVLRGHARRAGATLDLVADRASRRHLAELVRSAEDARRSRPEYAAEQARWTWWPGEPRCDGIPVDADVTHPDATVFAGRDYAGLTRMFSAPAGGRPSGRGQGLVVILSTDHDDPAAWLRAGEALQRVLLEAAGHGVMAAFCTQPLEVPSLRGRIRQTLSGGAFPQMILRLGYPRCVRQLPRRPVTDVLRVAGAALA
ncbi:Acg family FMN-binding oxidoreductase [Streptomyces sp. NBC_01235]|uniref:Acg family FMN-binding oxidoreductase n=1 Tax=Streptomyces sp. NBC_01235 TaxID=2903788 RepID=UPI002E1114ED|nr:nitroreductase family protein [Streptomyces sp. NBC_01235]